MKDYLLNIASRQCLFDNLVVSLRHLELQVGDVRNVTTFGVLLQDFPLFKCHHAVDTFERPDCNIWPIQIQLYGS